MIDKINNQNTEIKIISLLDTIKNELKTIDLNLKELLNEIKRKNE